ncbi:dodecin family protein [Parasphingorhabdus cellanae]|uniref:Dodecin domain-containing protein n=1 Tax=Parasphingorhabdus cellanae TaxID=2806553 RepID=A0ABX7T6L2_9SPHN|nr:dodecin family protein [Parasphingorhabdus cellanae]QTD56422.1 dodecin domain-containing protein [Parasphingorhabdus cellanae]
MSIAKTTEVISSSTKSVEDAVHNGIERASKTIKGISGVWVKDTKATVENNKISEWRVTMIITFVLND